MSEIKDKVLADIKACMKSGDKMAKQRRESIEQFTAADRTDLADAEVIELDIIKTYLPEQLSEAEIGSLIDKAVADTGAESIRDMGKVMGILKPELQGKADMSAVSSLVKSKLG